MTPAYAEIIDFIASGTTPETVAAFEASPATKAYVANLIEQERRGEISEVDRAELEHYLQLEHVMRLAKARARKLASS